MQCILQLIDSARDKADPFEYEAYRLVLPTWPKPQHQLHRMHTFTYVKVCKPLIECASLAPLAPGVLCADVGLLLAKSPGLELVKHNACIREGPPSVGCGNTRTLGEKARQAH